jgi:HAD superfamily hydrolase (TIGR01549 family)
VPFDAIFVDLFGTLLDEDSDYRAIDRTFGEVVERFRLKEDPRDLSGEYSLIVMELLAGESPADDKTPIVSYEGVAKGVFEGMMAARSFVVTDDDVQWFWDTHAGWQKREVKFFPDAAFGVREAAKRTRHVGLVTDADPYVATLLLPGFEAADLIRSVTTGKEVGAFKPNPSLFLAAAAKAGADPARCLMVGDSWERDIEGATSAGMQGVLLDRRRARTVDPSRTIPRLTDLPPLLDRLERGLPSATRPVRSAGP